MSGLNNLTAEEWGKCNNNVIWIDDAPWHIRNGILVPLFLPHSSKSVNKINVQKVLSNTNALLAHWSDDWGRENSEWWWTCCDNKNYDLDNINNARGRRGIRKGNMYCSVKRINANYFSDIAYKIYFKSLKSYGLGNNKIPSKEQFDNNVLMLSKYDGFEIWGAFIEEKLAAYTTCIIIDNAVSLGSTKSDPDFHEFYPNNALFYNVTRYYLKERSYSYVTNGYRTLLHPTEINDFLIRMGYKRIYCRLNIELSNYAKMILKSGIEYWNNYLNIFEKIFPNQIAKLNGFLKLVSIAKTFKS